MKVKLKRLENENEKWKLKKILENSRETRISLVSGRLRCACHFVLFYCATRKINILNYWFNYIFLFFLCHFVLFYFYCATRKINGPMHELGATNSVHQLHYLFPFHPWHQWSALLIYLCHQYQYCRLISGTKNQYSYLISGTNINIVDLYLAQMINNLDLSPASIINIVDLSLAPIINIINIVLKIQ